MSYSKSPVSPDKPTTPNFEGVNPKMKGSAAFGKGTEVYQGHIRRPLIDGGKSTPVEIGNDPYAKSKMAEFKKAGA